MSRKNANSGVELPTVLVDKSTGEVFPRFRSAYDHARPYLNFSSDVGEVSLTKQDFKDECDINKLMKRYSKNRDLSAFQESNARFLDLTQLPGSYHESLNLVIAAEEAFEALPASARARFGNDISVFMKAAAADPEGVFGPRDEEGRVIAPPPSEPPPAAPAAAPAASNPATPPA